MRPFKKITLTKSLPWILIVSGIIGLLCSAVLVYDHNKIVANPNYVPSCNLNPIIACGDVIKSKQAQAFAIPNPYIGLVAYPALATIGIAMLAGAKFKRWFWLGLETGSLFGVVFVHWLFYETVYRIHALCPYCMVVWVVTITTFWYVTLYNIEKKFIKWPKGKLQAVSSFARHHHIDLLLLWFLIIAALILKHFWYYYGKHLHI